ncbi:MAG: TA system VapC family ribonuclease toxin [Actinomycetota bacterium]
MRSVDVNVLVYAFDADSTHHQQALRSLEECAAASEPLVLFPFVLAGFMRVTTDRRILNSPASPAEAREFIDRLLAWPVSRVAESGARWWDTFSALLAEYQPRGAEVSDVTLAALAIEHGTTLVSFDRGFARFRGLRWINPAERV